MYYDYDALKKRAGIVNEVSESERKELEHRFWMLVDSSMRKSSSSKGYAEAVNTLLKMVPTQLLQRYLTQQEQNTDEGY